MRLALRFTLLAFLVSSLLVSAAGIPRNRRYEHGALANIQARATDAEATTAVATTKEAATATEASTTGGTRTSATSDATATGNATSTTQAHTQTSTTGLALATPTGFQSERSLSNKPLNYVDRSFLRQMERMRRKTPFPSSLPSPLRWVSVASYFWLREPS